MSIAAARLVSSNDVPKPAVTSGSNVFQSLLFWSRLGQTGRRSAVPATEANHAHGFCWNRLFKKLKKLARSRKGEGHLERYGRHNSCSEYG